MRELRHPVTGAIYGIEKESGLLRVEDGKRVGFYTCHGEWRSGECFDVDPQFCNWVGGPQDSTAMAKPFKSI